MTKKDLIQKIIKEKIPCYFISPHLDDAALSAGGLMAHFKRSGVPVAVATVFTKGDSPTTLSAKKFLRLSGFPGNTALLFRARSREDINAFRTIGIKPAHLGFVDALWRKIPSPGLIRRTLGRLLPEFIHVYPMYRFLVASNKISRRDRPLKEEVKEKLSKLIAKKENFIVFCPLGLNAHVDHVLTREACLLAFGGRVILWSDFPYNIRNAPKADEIAEIGIAAFEWKENFSEKLKMIEEYKSQLKGLFPDGNIRLVPEIYYEKR